MKKEEQKPQESIETTSAIPDQKAPVDPADETTERELADEELDLVAGGTGRRSRLM